MRRVLSWVAAAGSVCVGAAIAAPVRFFTWNSAGSHASARLMGVSVSPEGVLELAPQLERRRELGAAWGYALIPSSNGWAVATGGNGRIVFTDWEGTEVAAASLSDSHALTLEPERDGSLLVGTAPGGRVFRLRGNSVETIFETESSYVWDLLRSPEDRSLWVATGNPGRLYRIPERGDPELVFEGAEVHIRCLARLEDGSIVWGTSPSGRVQRWLAKERRVQTLFDSELEEVVQIVALDKERILVALNSGESGVPEALPPASQAPSSVPGAEPVPVVTVEVSPPMLSPPTTKGATPPVRSELFEVSFGGAYRSLWRSQDETVHGLHRDGNRVWIGTGRNGRIYQLVGNEVRRVGDLEDRFVVGFASSNRGLAVLTSEAAALWTLGSGRESVEGIYESDVFDAGQPARFGEFRWQGELPPGSRVRAAARSGWSREVDGSWSPWSQWKEIEQSQILEVPPGRFAQLRIELRGATNAGPKLVAFDWAYRQLNLPPRLERVQVLEPGQVLVSTSFNPADQIYEPSSPNREGLFTTLEPALPRDDRLKTLWRRGWRTVRWKASDPNQDELRASVAVRRESPGEPLGPWLEIAADVANDYISFDASVLPEGGYRFQVRVTDARTSGGEEALEGIALSELARIDHTAPELRSTRLEDSTLTVEVGDLWSPLREIAIAVDGGPWRPVVPEDGLVDGPVERIRLAVSPGSRSVLLRVGDSAFNYATFDLSPGRRKR